MSVVAIRQSQKARSIATEILLERLPMDLTRDRFDADVAFDGKGRLGMIPVFSLKVEDLHSDRLHNAWRMGWRYIWIHPAIGAGAIVSILSNTKERAQLSRYHWGKRATEFAVRLDQTVERFQEVPGRQRVRLLSLAQVQMEALWITSYEVDALVGIVPELNDEAFLDEAGFRLNRMTLAQADADRHRGD